LKSALVRHASAVGTPGVDLIVPRELVRATGRLAGAQVFVSASLPLNATVGAVAAKRLSGHEGLAGTSVGIAFLFSVLSLYVVSSVAQNLGRKPVLLAGLSLLALGATICGLAIWIGSYALFIVGTAIFGTGQGPSTLGRAAAADLYPPVLRGRGVGSVATAGAIGAVVGPLIAIAAGGGAVYLGIVRGAGPFLVVPLLGIVAVWLIARLHPDPRDVASNLGRWYRRLPPIPEPPPPRPRAELIRLGPARAAITATALGQGAMVGVMSITSVELGDNGWADWQVQLLMAAHFVGMFALAYPVGLLADRIGRRRTSLLGLGACAVGSFGTALTGASPLITPFFFLLGLGWAGCFVAGTSILADITSPRERGVLTASNDLIVALCAAAASISAGLLLSGAGFWAVGAVFGVLLAFAVPGLLRLQEPAVGVYIETPAAELARHTA
jgi:MFS family permease